MADSTVCLAYLHDDTVSHSWHHSVVNLLMHDASGRQRIIRGGYIAFSSGYDLERSRNQVVAQFLDNKTADWLFWVDSDMGFAPDSLERLVQAADPVNAPVVGGLCFGWKDIASDGLNGMVRRPFTTMFRWAEKADGSAAFNPIGNYPPNEVLPVDATGAAFVLVHRSVFEAIEAKYGRVWYSRIPNPTIPGSVFGEDVSFCIRAGACDKRMFVHTGIRTNHHKMVHVDEAVFWQHQYAPPAAAEVAVLVPVMRRPQNAAPFMASLRASTGLARVYAVADRSDTDTIAAWQAAGAEVIWQDDLGTFAKKVNYGYRNSTEPWVFIVGDDVRFHAGWYDHALHAATVRGCDVVGVNDLGNPRVLAGEHATHLLIRRGYIDEHGASWDGPGVVCHEGYAHNFVDDEIVAAAKQRHMFTVALASIVEHMHPVWEKGEPDDVYALGRQSAMQDKKKFKRRSEQNKWVC